MKTSLKSIVILGVAAVAVTGCGPLKQDPTSDYAVSKKTTQDKPANARTQEHADSGLAVIDIDDVLNFTEGQASSYTVTPRILVAGVQYGLTMTGAPAGAKLTQRVAGHPEQGYEFSWTPAVGTIGPSDLVKVTDVVFKIVVSADSNPKAKAVLSGLTLDHSAHIVLQKTGEIPVISQVKKASDVVTQGEAVAVTVTVDDPGSYGHETPEIAVVNLRTSNKDFSYVRGAQFVDVNPTPTALGGNKYRFDLKLDTAQAVLPTGDSADVKFVVYVLSPSGHRSASEEVDVKVNRKDVAAPAPAKPAEPAKPAPAKPATGAKP